MLLFDWLKITHAAPQSPDSVWLFLGHLLRCCLVVTSEIAAIVYCRKKQYLWLNVKSNLATRWQDTSGHLLYMGITDDSFLN